MKISSVNEYGEVILEEVYNPIILRTQEGVEYTICMRDYGLEIHESSVGVISLQPNELPQLLMVNKLDKDE